MKIGIIGTGIVGRMHAAKLTSLGHEVMIGTRDVAKTLEATKTDSTENQTFLEWFDDYPDVLLGTFDEACEYGEIIINALRGTVVLEVFGALNKDFLKGKLVIDIANVLDFSQGMPPVLLTRDGNSLGEQLQRLLPGVKVVKTLNTLTAYLQVNPLELAGGDHQIFMSGNDVEAKKVVRTLLGSYGWKNIMDLGDITTARGTELLMPMWLRLWEALDTPMFNYKIIK